MTEGNHEKNTNEFGQHRDLNSELSEYESSAMNFDRRYVLCIQKLITDCTSQSAGAEIRAFNFNRYSDGTVRIREILLVHASWDVISLSRSRSRFKQYMV